MPTATFAELIDILTYINYCHNRRHNATMPSDWKLIYGADMVNEMERKYQEEASDE